jgi:hypothetical protein
MVQAQAANATPRVKATRSVSIYPDVWQPLSDEAWRLRISTSELLERILTKRYGSKSRKREEAGLSTN